MTSINRSEARAKEAALAISHVRNSHQTFTTEQLVQFLKEQNCPYAAYVPKALLSEGHIVKQGKVFKFAHSEPIYFGSIRRHLDNAYEMSVSPSKGIKKALILKEEHLPGAIELLKNHGYRIFKEC